MDIENLEQFIEDYSSRYDKKIYFLDFFPGHEYIRAYLGDSEAVVWHKDRSFTTQTVTAIIPTEGFAIIDFEEMVDIINRSGYDEECFDDCFIEEGVLIMRDWDCEYSYHYHINEDELERKEMV